MRRRTKLTAKKPEVKKDSSVSKAKKTDFSQSKNFPIGDILILQRTIGNQAVQRLIESGVIQAKADRVADQVMQVPDSRIQRQVKEEKEKETVRKKLEFSLDKVKTSLTREYIKGLLQTAATCQLLGLDAAAKMAIEEAAETASELLKSKIAMFDPESAKEEMVKSLLNAAADVQALGGDAKAAQSAIEKSLKWAKVKLDKAVKRLEKAPTEEAARQVAVKAGLVQLFGGDTTKEEAAILKALDILGKEKAIKSAGETVPPSQTTVKVGPKGL